uniref:Uncharacterized protein n=1 Tax=viral metagenome TaxID=1070528 RepID=A0A6C0CFD5_9ZZZZ
MDDPKLTNVGANKFGHVKRQKWLAVLVRFSDTKTCVRFCNDERYPERYFDLAYFDKDGQLHCDVYGKDPSDIDRSYNSHSSEEFE